MKNIKILKRALSLLVLVLIVASSVLLTGCRDPHEGHDHSTNNLGVLTPLSKIAKADSYPTVSAYKPEDVKKNVKSDGLLILYVIKQEGNQLYCTNNNSDVANYIIVDSTVKVTPGDYFVCDAKAYSMTSEDFGFEASSLKFSTFYVVFGEEMKNPKQITRENAANIFASVPSAPDMDDDHAGHNH